MDSQAQGGLGRIAQVTCLMTRFEMKHWWSGMWVIWHFRRTKRSIRDSPGALEQLLLWESPRAAFSISLWDSPVAMMSAVTTEHIQAIHYSARACRAVWSTQWHLTRLSRTRQQWPASRVEWNDLARQSGATAIHYAALTYCDGHPRPVSSDNAPLAKQRIQRIFGGSDVDRQAVPLTQRSV